MHLDFWKKTLPQFCLALIKGSSPHRSFPFGLLIPLGALEKKHLPRRNPAPAQQWLLATKIEALKGNLASNEKSHLNFFIGFPIG